MIDTKRLIFWPAFTGICVALLFTKSSDPFNSSWRGLTIHGCLTFLETLALLWPAGRRDLAGRLVLSLGIAVIPLAILFGFDEDEHLVWGWSVGAFLVSFAYLSLRSALRNRQKVN